MKKMSSQHPRGCFILELWNKEEDPTVSVARARLTAEIKKNAVPLSYWNKRTLLDCLW
jgi:hypothetical protein